MKKVLTLLIFISSFSIFAQGEANNWYFGRNAGITFNTNPPSAVNNGQLSTNEGCSSISDVNGNLLMYTDGRTIWNRNHQIMSNADYFNGTGLHGDPSSTSSGLIVPHPSEPNLYYVFTVDEPHHDNANAYPNQGPADSDGNSIPFYTDVTSHRVPQDDDGFNNGLNYSLVDMSLNGGLGDVISDERNNELITYDPNDSEEIKYKASEKITAVRGRDCNSVWLITHFRNRFYAFSIDENGIDETPVISTVPPLIEISNYRRAALGYLKASPNADKLLTAHNTTNFNAESNTDFGDGNVYAYDFDNLTGLVSNPVELISNVNAYGVEFSQDGTKAYATASDFSAKIFQWDLSAEDIPGSIQTIADVGQSNTALQLGPDGKIYHSLFDTSTLGVIENPNEEGQAVNYIRNQFQGAISLNNRTSTFGLPPFIQSLFSKRIPIVETQDEEVIEQVDLCDTYSYTLNYEDIPGATYTWSKNGEVIQEETDFFLDISIDDDTEFPLEENYRLEVDLNNGECPLIGVAQLTFNQSPDYSNGQLTACAETGVDAIFDLTEVKTILSEETETELREVEVELYRSQEDADLLENPIQVIPDFENAEGLSSIFIRISTYQVCDEIVEFELIRQEFPTINLDTEVIPYCVDNFPDPITINALEDDEDPLLYDYLWNTGEESPTIEVNSAGSYSVDIKFSEENCFVTKTILVEESQPSFNYETLELCDINQYTIEQNEYTEGTFTWYQNDNEISGETNPSLTLNIPQDAEFPFSNTYTLEVDLEDGSCLKTFGYDLTFNISPTYNEVELKVCNDFEAGFGIFNLENSIIELVDGVDEVSTEDITVEFYQSREEALREENQIQNPQSFENSKNLETIFANVESFNSCLTLVDIQLFTFSFPNLNPENESLIYCLEDFPETVQLQALVNGNNTNDYSFLWSTSETSQTININKEGLYTVEISNPDFNCSIIKEFEVRESNIADFDYSIERFNDLSTVEISINSSSLGDYEFAINEAENFQESNTFENLTPGVYTVYVRDRFGCGVSQKTIGVLGIMKFFTPNGDGINDIWEISGLLDNNEEDILLQVYDRYGKLLKSFTNRDRGWDGTYNGRNMPSDDYWYKVRLTDGTIETGNFTLRR